MTQLKTFSLEIKNFHMAIAQAPLTGTVVLSSAVAPVILDNSPFLA